VSKHKDHAVFIPIRFYDAQDLGDVTQRQFDVGVKVARGCYDAKNTSDGWAVVPLKPLAEKYGVSEDTIGRDLRALEPTWIQCDVKSGQRAWRIRLTGLHSPPRPPLDLRTTSAPEPPPMRSLTSAERESQDSARPLPEPVSAESQPPHSGSEPTDTRPDPTRATACNEGAVGTTRGLETLHARAREDGRTTDRLLAAVSAVGGENEPTAFVEQARKAQATLPEPGSPDFVAAVLRRHPPSDRERLRLLELHRDASLTGPTLDDVLEAEVAALVSEGVLVPPEGTKTSGAAEERG
jgi:hypothetical protein